VLWLVVTANIVPSSLILVTLMMEAIRFSETLVLIRATQHNIPEDSILCNYIRLVMLLKMPISVSAARLTKGCHACDDDICVCGKAHKGLSCQ
jgi:hypothetical protein